MKSLHSLRSDLRSDRHCTQGGLSCRSSSELGKNWKAIYTSKEIKELLYHSLVQSIVLYNAETWTSKQENKTSLRVFEMLVLRKILGCTRRDRVRNADIIIKDLASDMDIVEVLRLRRLTYFGHYIRTDPNRYPHRPIGCMVTLTVSDQEEGPGRGGLTTLKKTVPPYNSHFLTQTDWPRTDLVGGH